MDLEKGKPGESPTRSDFLSCLLLVLFLRYLVFECSFREYRCVGKMAFKSAHPDIDRKRMTRASPRYTMNADHML
jgi:hypothetical protein